MKPSQPVTPRAGNAWESFEEASADATDAAYYRQAVRNWIEQAREAHEDARRYRRAFEFASVIAAITTLVAIAALVAR